MVYSLRETYKNFVMRKSTNVAAVSTITASLFVLSLFLLGTINLLKIIRDFHPKMDMTVFLKDNMNLKERREIEELIESRAAVKHYEYISKEQALDEFKSELADTPELFEALDVNPLPSSFRIELNQPHSNPDELIALASALERMDGVEEVKYSERLVTQLQRLFSGAILIDIILGISLCLATFYVVGNTIKLLVYARRDAIEIMKLVGATDAFIRRPFLIVGLIQGALGGGFAATLLYVFYLAVKMKISGIVFPGMEMVAGLIGFGSILGLLGSLISVRKFLKV
ncbi:hypothetical protein AMJ40_07830 [candidate division TA06 bacterium DG_26]|uniref:Cell division protein FtsX n=1 Tax=candidate division TA06 bacterium DG_26 TaxID=1703771 RepID=A0A0S7WDL0_UNCT6|nr:MAG: hypothetical protein AMJ40_07830 [candidate division TA06 bacterium DG_26]